MYERSFPDTRMHKDEAQGHGREWVEFVDVRAGRYGKMDRNEIHGDFNIIFINIPTMLIYGKYLKNSLTEGGYMEVHGKLKYGIRPKLVVLFSLIDKTLKLIMSAHLLVNINIDYIGKYHDKLISSVHKHNTFFEDGMPYM